ncbi:hypothetical protein BZG36_03224 [Bifiguratus adelaidae]|uniref:UAA transporter n=1 Tax=Bifiguratus adelaidae TaxID=1938954 RepID=A0A261XWW0_9FUNG|nr:hypothetical protein BZG36_03224 [Bifiguratus adelaidae]
MAQKKASISQEEAPPRSQKGWADAAAWSMGFLQVGFTDLALIGGLIFGGCCSNVFALELLVTDAPKSGNLITFAQFLFVAVDGFLHHITWPKTSFLPTLKPRKVPIWRWLVQVLLFFTVSVLNNAALAYQISVPLHIVFRSGGLFMNMLLGVLILKKKYTLSQYIAVGLVTAGVVLVTLSNASTPRQQSSGPVEISAEYITGIVLLSLAMMLSALMGLFQEVTYKQYGKHWREGLFYSHFLSLPMFLLFYKDIQAQLVTFTRSPEVSVIDLVAKLPLDYQWFNTFFTPSVRHALSSLRIPQLWFFLALNVITQYVCISGVHRLTAISSSLTLNLILNLRKFVSLVISIVYFKNPFGLGAVTGTVCVFIGMFMYTVAGSMASRASPKKVN